ncbi:E3 ubiquitin-protein ligase TRIM39 [Merluccius polli]|uniref:E3 ubiquitin-protein ligase TRIM39 n=1 Tax=Merluccius polli TaxID=89951 RepID=A0AA47M282_MERPO|nr:E3 ubiquitin-protein ligase TRIM39 [Merluccius polli]
MGLSVSSTMFTLKTKLQLRQSDGFFGAQMDVLLQQFPDRQAAVLREDMCNFYQSSLTYLEQRYDFSDSNYQKKLASLALNKSPFNFSHLCEAVEVLQLSKKLDMDALYDEYCVVLPHQQAIVQSGAPVVENCKDFYTYVVKEVLLNAARSNKKYNIFWLAPLICPGCSYVMYLNILFQAEITLCVYQMLNRETGVSSPCDIVPEENRGEACKPKPEKDKRLKKAIGDLSTWTWTLSDKEEESVHLDEDVGVVVKDMMRQWKRGKLPNILPVMDFVIWSILQQDGQKVRLDPSTANVCLEIFKFRRAVKMMQIIESEHNPWDDFRRTKNQFDGWWCALGSEGFVSGQHYWEVDIRGKSEWRIGVARESAPRNGFKSLNTTTGYQILKLQLGQLMAMTSPVTRLDRCVPSVLGLFLDMEEGHVSFYDVDHRFHIYSFDVSFEHAHTPFFSVASDASNHGTTKLFPLSVRYWTPDLGVQTKVLDFYDDNSHQAGGKRTGTRHDICGRYNSVFQKLKENNNCILKANCVAHIVHNSAKHAGDRLNIDIEYVVNKTFSHFSSSAKRTEELKSIHTFVEIEYQSLLRNVPTRWLSLWPAVKRLHDSWAPIKTYFLSLGEDGCPKSLWRLFKDDQDGEGNPLDLQVYLSFLSNALKIFHDTVLE